MNVSSLLMKVIGWFQDEGWSLAQTNLLIIYLTNFILEQITSYKSD